MRLTNMKISNFKAISDEINISLTPNAHGVNKNLETGYFKKEGNLITPNIIGFIGRNGVGKTTILEAIATNFNINNKGLIGKGIIDHALSKNQELLKNINATFDYEFMNKSVTSTTQLRRKYLKYIEGKSNHGLSESDLEFIMSKDKDSCQNFFYP